VRVLTYIFVGVGAAIAVIALAVTLLDTGEQAKIEPQSDASQTVTAKAQTTGNGTLETQQSADGAGGGGQTSNGAGSVGAGNDGAGSGAATSTTSSSQPATDEPVPPTVSIDLAQVRPDGNAVFAGKATPNAEVTVFEGDVILGRTRADENGEWVIIPDAALGAGEHLVSVGVVSEDGRSSVADITMAIQVGETTEDRPLVALLPQTETDMPKLLQSPDDIAAPAVERPAPVAGAATSTASVTASDTAMPVVPAIAPRSLSWKADGELVVAGVSRGGVRVDAVANGISFGDTDTAKDGSWQLAGKVDMAKSRRTMIFTLRNADNAVIATYELPVATRDLSQGLDGSRMVIVQRGDALWRIAYSSYGEGIRYVDIVRRNAAAINDPDLIFPNQIFALPKSPE
jgi:nucleoid-associated protein YgaU